MAKRGRKAKYPIGSELKVILYIGKGRGVHSCTARATITGHGWKPDPFGTRLPDDMQNQWCNDGHEPKAGGTYMTAMVQFETKSFHSKSKIYPGLISLNNVLGLWEDHKPDDFDSKSDIREEARKYKIAVKEILFSRYKPLVPNFQCDYSTEFKKLTCTSIQFDGLKGKLSVVYTVLNDMLNAGCSEEAYEIGYRGLSIDNQPDCEKFIKYLVGQMQ